MNFTDDALVAAANLADRYISDRFLPDKAIDLIDEAGIRMRIRRMTAPPDVREIDEKIAEVRLRKESAIDAQDFERAASLRDEERQLQEEKARREAEWKSGEMDILSEVDEEEIAEVLSIWTGIPVFKLTEEETEKLLRMEDELHKRIVDQNEAISAVSRAIRRTRSGLKDPRRPSGSFIFLGPSGVGKTELSKALAEFLFGDEDALIQLDMSEYMEKHTVSRLIGSPPGYVGYEEGGQLTEAVRRKPFSVVLFDEIEKAHPDVFNTLLQILEDGHLTDSQGHKVDFKNTIIIMTSNLGTRDIQKGPGIGFAASANEEVTYEKMRDRVTEELKKSFRPEFLNRIDEVIVFRSLTQEDVKNIVDLMMTRVRDQLKAKDIDIELTDAAKTLLASQGYDARSGPGRCAGPSSAWSRTRSRRSSCGRSSAPGRRSSSMRATARSCSTAVDRPAGRSRRWSSPARPSSRTAQAPDGRAAPLDRQIRRELRGQTRPRSSSGTRSANSQAVHRSAVICSADRRTPNRSKCSQTRCRSRSNSARGMPVLPRVDRLREIDDRHLSVPDQDVVRRQVAVDDVAIEEQLDVADHLPQQLLGLIGIGAIAAQLRRGVVLVADVRHEETPVRSRDRPRHVRAARPKGSSTTPTRDRPRSPPATTRPNVVCFSTATRTRRGLMNSPSRYIPSSRKSRRSGGWNTFSAASVSPVVPRVGADTGRPRPPCRS